MNGKQTRKIIIDRQIKKAGWDIKNKTQVIEEFDIFTGEVAKPKTHYPAHLFSNCVLLEKGEITKRNLLESYFNMNNPEGIRGMFTPKEIDEVLSLTNKILAP